MSLFDKLKAISKTGIKAVLKGIKKAPSAAWWLLTKSPKLLRRGVQVAAIYLGSLVAEKLLDKAHEKLPDNELVAKADTIVHAAVNAEDFLLGGVTSLAKTAYDTVPAAKAAPPRIENDTPKTPPVLEPVTDTEKLETESIKQAERLDSGKVSLN